MASPHTETVTGTFTLKVFNRQGLEAGEVTVDAADFGGKISPRLLHEAVLMYEANQRQGTHHTLRRGEVAGSTKKMFRQKGTGNARAGTKRTNKRRGGGTAKGPKPRDYSYALPRQALKAATRMAVLSKIRDNAAVVVDDFGLAAIKTKDMAGILKADSRGARRPRPGRRQPRRSRRASRRRSRAKKNLSLLIGTDKLDPVVYKSARNLDGVRVLPASDFNAYEVLRPRRLVLTRSALDALRTAGKA